MRGATPRSLSRRPRRTCCDWSRDGACGNDGIHIERNAAPFVIFCRIFRAVETAPAGVTQLRSDERSSAAARPLARGAVGRVGAPLVPGAGPARSESITKWDLDDAPFGSCSAKGRR
jgi:hypothetical protein